MLTFPPSLAAVFRPPLSVGFFNMFSNLLGRTPLSSSVFSAFPPISFWTHQEKKWIIPRQLRESSVDTPATQSPRPSSSSSSLTGLGIFFCFVFSFSCCRRWFGWWEMGFLACLCRCPQDGDDDDKEGEQFRINHQVASGDGRCSCFNFFFFLSCVMFPAFAFVSCSTHTSSVRLARKFSFLGASFWY